MRRKRGGVEIIDTICSVPPGEVVEVTLRVNDDGEVEVACRYVEMVNIRQVALGNSITGEAEKIDDYWSRESKRFYGWNDESCRVCRVRLGKMKVGAIPPPIYEDVLCVRAAFDPRLSGARA